MWSLFCKYCASSPMSMCAKNAFPDLCKRGFYLVAWSISVDGVITGQLEYGFHWCPKNALSTAHILIYVALGRACANRNCHRYTRITKRPNPRYRDHNKNHSQYVRAQSIDCIWQLSIIDCKFYVAQLRQTVLSYQELILPGNSTTSVIYKWQFFKYTPFIYIN